MTEKFMEEAFFLQYNLNIALETSKKMSEYERNWFINRFLKQKNQEKQENKVNNG